MIIFFQWKNAGQLETIEKRLKSRQGFSPHKLLEMKSTSEIIQAKVEWLGDNYRDIFKEAIRAGGDVDNYVIEA